MTRIEPDGYLPRSMVGYADDAAVYRRSTVLRAIDEEIAAYGFGGETDSEAYHALIDLRARFQPTEGENGHE